MPPTFVEFFNNWLSIVSEGLADDGVGVGLTGIDSVRSFEVVGLFVGRESAIEDDGIFDNVQPVALGVGEPVALLVEP